MTGVGTWRSGEGDLAVTDVSNEIEAVGNKSKTLPMIGVSGRLLLLEPFLFLLEPLLFLPPLV